jgi:hypothetical protein
VSIQVSRKWGNDYLVMAKVWERTAVSKGTMYIFHIGKSNRNNMACSQEQYHVEISDIFAALENCGGY